MKVILGFVSWDRPILGKCLKGGKVAGPWSSSLQAQHLQASLQSSHRPQQRMLTSMALHGLHHQVPKGQAAMAAPLCSITPGVISSQHFCISKQQLRNRQQYSVQNKNNTKTTNPRADTKYQALRPITICALQQHSQRETPHFLNDQIIC